MTHGSSSISQPSISPVFAGLALAVVLSALSAASARANPEGGKVVGGSASIVMDSAVQTTIHQHSNKAIINWRNFSIGAGETTKFVQPSASSAVLNRVTSNQVSRILGNLTANGKVFLINPNGVVFGNNAKVDVGALITSTHDIKDTDFMADRLRFTLSGQAGARITNHGSISVREGGLVALVAPSIENAGVIYARLGRVALAAGDAVTIDPYGDDLITFEVPEDVARQLADPEQNPLAALIDLSGDIIADGGGVLITADKAKDMVDQAVNMTGYVQARSLETSGGKVVLRGGGGDVTVAGTIDVSGVGKATGGEVRVTTHGALTTTAASRVLAEGGTEGGDGGFAAVSAWARAETAGRVSVKARAETGGNGWLYEGTNVAAAETMRNPNDAGAGRVGEGINSVYFEENKGQTDASVSYLARGENEAIYLTAAEAVLALQTESGAETTGLSLVGSNADTEAVGEQKTGAVVNYYIGNDPDQWIEGAETYKQVRYKDVYDGIDLVYYGNRTGDLEYDLQVKAGADASQIKLDYSGAEGITKTAQGDLVIDTGERHVVQKAPLVYQETADARVIVPGDYDVAVDGKVSIQLDSYDTSKALIVDPIIDFSSFHGGTLAESSSTGRAGVESDSSGNMYIVGSTGSTDFPTASAFDGSLGNVCCSDAFVSKVDTSGNLVYSTYLGGTLTDFGFDIAVDGTGNAYVTGQTISADFPTASAADATQSANDAFVAGLNTTGGALIFSTYLGGSGNEIGYGIDADAAGNTYVTGSTTSADLSVTGADEGTLEGAQDAFVAVYNAAGAVTRTTYLGGSGAETGYDIAVDGSGNYAVTGETQSADFATVLAAQGARSGAQDAFIVRYNTGGTKLFSTYLGGTGNETGFGIKEGPNGDIYVTGESTSSDFTTLNAAQSSSGGGTDAFLTSYGSTGTLLFSTYFGGSGTDSSLAIDVKSDGTVYIAGATGSTDLPTLNSTQSASGGGNDAFVAEYSSSGARSFSTYLGGSGTDEAYGITTLTGNQVAVVGQTASSAFTTASAFQGSLGGSSDAFITRFDFSPTPPGPPSPQSVARQQFVGRTTQAPQALDSLIVTIPPQPTTATIDGGVTESLAVVSEQRIERAVKTVTTTGIDSGTDFMQGSGEFSFSEERTVFQRLEVTVILDGLAESEQAISDLAVEQFQQVLEGTGPSFAEFNAFLEASALDERQAQTYRAMYLRMADARQEQVFSNALAELSANPLITDPAPGTAALQSFLPDEVAPETESLQVSTDGSTVLTAQFEELEAVAEAFIGGERIAVGDSGEFQVRFTDARQIDENVSITIVHRDGSVSERPLFDVPPAAATLFTFGDQARRDEQGRIVLAGRLVSPESVTAVLVNGQPVPLSVDGTVQFESAETEQGRDFATVIVARDDGRRELHKIAVSESPAILDAVTSSGQDNENVTSGTLARPDEVAQLLIDGQPVALADDGRFEFETPETADPSVTVTIIYTDGSKTGQILALDQEIAIDDLESYRTAGGLKMTQGRLENTEGVAEVRINGAAVPVDEDGAFVAAVTDAAAAEEFLAVTVVFEDGSQTTRQMAPSPETLVETLDSEVAEDGSVVTQGRLAKPELVAEIRLGDTPVEMTEDGTFSVAFPEAILNRSFELTILYGDGSRKIERLRRDASRGAIADLRPVRGPGGKRYFAGRVRAPSEVVQVWVEGRRVAVAADGAFRYAAPEGQTEISGALDISVIFNDGAQHDQMMALRATSPLDALETRLNDAGQPVADGKLDPDGDVAEVRVGGRPVEVAADGSFTVALDQNALIENGTVSVSIIHGDGTRTERTLAAEPRAVFESFSPVLSADGELAIKDGTARAEGVLAAPETVAEVRVNGEDVKLGDDGRFVIEISETVVNIDDSVSVTVIFKDGSQVEEQLALVDAPIEEALEALITPDGSVVARGRLEETEGVAEVRIGGRTAQLEDDGTFEQAISEAREQTDVNIEEILTTINEAVAVTIIYANGTRSEKALILDTEPVLAQAETRVVEDGAVILSAQLAELEDVDSVLVDGQAVELGPEEGFEIRLESTVINIERSVDITIVFEDGRRRVQRVAVGTAAAFETLHTVARRDGRPVLAGRLERATDVAALRVGGQAVEVAEDGRFEFVFSSSVTTTESSVSVTILYKDGARVDQNVALRETAPVANSDLALSADGVAVATLQLANVEDVAEVRIDGRQVVPDDDGTVRLNLTDTQTNVDESVSLTIVFKDGSRLEQKTALTQRPVTEDVETVSLSATENLFEGRVADIENVAQVLLDGTAVPVNDDGSFRLAVRRTETNIRRSYSLTVIYADGTRKVRRLGVTERTMFRSLDTFSTQTGVGVIQGRLTESGQVSRLVINDRPVDVSADGRFAVDLSRTDADISRPLSVTLIYNDGGRVSRSVAVRNDSLFDELNTVAGAVGSSVIAGRLAERQDIASIRLGAQEIAIGADGRFEVDLSEAILQSSENVSLQITYRDTTRQAKSLSVRAGNVLAGFDTYSAANGGGVVEGRFSDPASIAQVFMDGRPLNFNADGAFVFRQTSASTTTATSVSLRVIYKDGSVAGRQIAMSANADRTIMQVENVSVSADGTALAEARLSNAREISALEIGGQTFDVRTDGRVVFSLTRQQAVSSNRIAIRILYANGLSAESWIRAGTQAGAAAALPRVPRKVALIMGNGTYGRGIPGVETARADSALVRNIFRTRFGFQARVLQNASKAEISATLGRLSRELGRNDQLMVYYAGRSHVDQRTGRGYWLPRDAQSTSARNWISNDTVYNLLRRMNLRQALVMSDSQFAVSAHTRTLRVRSSRQTRRSQISVIASGALAPVRAASGDTHSAFTWRLASTLASVGDATPATDLFRVIRERLTGNVQRPVAPGQQVLLEQPHTLLR